MASAGKWAEHWEYRNRYYGSKAFDASCRNHGGCPYCRENRTHQIRVHFAAIGYPVVADPVYGVKSAHLSRQFMHATRIGFKQPSTGEYIELESELPADLAQALERIA